MDIPGIELLYKIGRGGMGTVYLGEDLRHDRAVAVKLLSKDGKPLEEETLQRFSKEIAMAASLSDRNIATVYESGSIGDDHYYVMEFVDGIPIDEYCAKKKASEAETIDLVRQVCRAIQYAHSHEKRIIHRDLKPENILVNKEGVVKVLDFGIAKSLAANRQQTIAGTIAGTPEFMSPEQARGEDLDVRSDAYSVGVILYYLLCRKLPYGTDELPLEVMRQVIEVEPPRPTGVPRVLADITLRALAKSRDERYQSTADLSDDLQCYLSGEPTLASRNSTVDQLRWLFRRHKKVLIPAAIVALCVLGFAFYHVKTLERSNERATLAFSEAISLTGYILGDASDLLRQSGRTDGIDLIAARAAEFPWDLEIENPTDDPELGFTYLRSRTAFLQGEVLQKKDMHEKALVYLVEAERYALEYRQEQQTPKAVLWWSMVRSTLLTTMAKLGEAHDYPADAIDILNRLKVAGDEDAKIAPKTLHTRVYLLSKMAAELEKAELSAEVDAEVSDIKASLEKIVDPDHERNVELALLGAQVTEISARLAMSRTKNEDDARVAADLAKAAVEEWKRATRRWPRNVQMGESLVGSHILVYKCLRYLKELDDGAGQLSQAFDLWLGLRNNWIFNSGRGIEELLFQSCLDMARDLNRARKPETAIEMCDLASRLFRASADFVDKPKIDEHGIVPHLWPIAAETHLEHARAKRAQRLVEEAWPSYNHSSNRYSHLQKSEPTEMRWLLRRAEVIFEWSEMPIGQSPEYDSKRLSEEAHELLDSTHDRPLSDSEAARVATLRERYPKPDLPTKP